MTAYHHHQPCSVEAAISFENKETQLRCHQIEAVVVEIFGHIRLRS